MGEKSIASLIKRERLLRRTTAVASKMTTTSATTPATEKTAIIAGLFWKKDVREDRSGVWLEDGEDCAVIDEVSVMVCSLGGIARIGEELGSVGADVGEGMEELVSGELVGGGEGLLVVLAALLRVGVERNGLEGKEKLTV